MEIIAVIIFIVFGVFCYCACKVAGESDKEDERK